MHDYGMILEDDADFSLTKYWKENLSDFIKKNAPNDWDIIQLHSDAPFPTYNTYCIHPLCGSTAAYLISKKGAIKIIKYLKESFFEKKSKPLIDIYIMHG